MYFLADILTLSEFALTGVLCSMTLAGAPADVVIWVFVAAQLCDAFDGPCARRWPYPASTNYWWRKPQVVQAAEHTSDIALLSMLGIFLLTQKNPVVHWVTLIYGITLASFCVGIEVALQILGRYAPEDKRRRVIMIRRIAYLIGIAIGIAELIFCTSWPHRLKIALYVIGIIAGIALIIYKWDRFTETHDTFRDFLRRIAQRQKP